MKLRTANEGPVRIQYNCLIWERGRAVSFLGINVSNFRYSALCDVGVKGSTESRFLRVFTHHRTRTNRHTRAARDTYRQDLCVYLCVLSRALHIDKTIINGIVSELHCYLCSLYVFKEQKKLNEKKVELK
jgi:hypothetical protein